ncbi:MAG: aminotransferase class V-fold PLP-dependent enzyme [Acidimicrobiia bacterium]|nr:aminotransferase class V-fold PLP-dependent enzyme [Acidimicrobiia bacterium]
MTVYLDHASATPIVPQARAAMAPWLERAADPARVHSDGREARAAVEAARDQVGERLGVRPRDVIFTGSGTEALNWVVYAAAGLTPKSRGPWGRRIVVTAVEHTAVLDAARLAATRAGLDLVEIPVDTDGSISPFEVPPDTALVACQHVNHETGVVQPVEEVAERCAGAGARLLVDACQSVGVTVPHADFVVVSGRKWGGPAGTGALGLGRRVRIDPLLVGGEQELLRRAGGENVSGIVGLGAACATPFPDLVGLRDDLVAGLGSIAGVEVVGLGARRAPQIVCATATPLGGEALLIGLDRAGIMANSGSSCSAERLEPSHVLRAMGADADSSLRFGLGWDTTASDIAAVNDTLPSLVAELRSLREHAGA